MSLGLLAPLALGLSILVAGPILAHMARQRPRQKVEYGLMILLRRLLKRTERKRRLRDRFLLLLRALAVLLIVLAAAQPRLSWPGDAPEFGGTGAVVIVLDDSMSMGLTHGDRSLMAEARSGASGVVRGLPEGTLVGLVTLGGEATRLTTSLTSEHNRVLERIEATEAGYGRTDLSAGLRHARALLAGQPGEILVFSDQAGPGTVSSATAELATLIGLGHSVIPRLVEADPPQNVAVVDATYGDGLEGGTVEVRVANFGPEPVERALTLVLPDDEEITAFVEIPAEDHATERFTIPQTVPGGVASVRVHDEGLSLDDTRYFHLPRVGASRVLVIDGDPGVTPFKSEVYFLERALAPWGGRRGGVVPEIASPVGLSRLSPEVHQVVFLANVAEPSLHASLLLDFVRSGGALVLGMGENITPSRYNGSLRDLLPTPLRERADLVDLDATSTGTALELPSAEHPVFRPFTRSGLDSFRRITARRAMRVEPYEESEEVETLLRWEDGTPALISRKVGQGRVVLWTSSFDKDWTNAPLEAVFVPFAQRLVGWLGGASGGGALRFEATVGERTTLELPLAGLEPQVVGPDGERVLAEIARGDPLELRFTPARPGAYAVGIEGEPPVAWVAANVPAAESDVRVFETLTEATAAIDPRLLEQHASLGPGALGAAIILLLAQALVSMRRAE